MHQQQTAFENIVGKEEIAHKEQFLLFPQCFSINQIIAPHFFIFLTSYFYLLLNSKSPKLAYEVKRYVMYRTYVWYDSTSYQYTSNWYQDQGHLHIMAKFFKNLNILNTLVFQKYILVFLFIC